MVRPHAVCFWSKKTLFLLPASVASGAGGVLYALSYMPYSFIASNYQQLNRGLKALSCLLSNGAMGIGCQIVGQFEGKGKTFVGLFHISLFCFKTFVKIFPNWTGLHAVFLKRFLRSKPWCYFVFWLKLNVLFLFPLRQRCSVENASQGSHSRRRFHFVGCKCACGKVLRFYDAQESA